MQKDRQTNKRFEPFSTFHSLFIYLVCIEKWYYHYKGRLQKNSFFSGKWKHQPESFQKQNSEMQNGTKTIGGWTLRAKLASSEFGFSFRNDFLLPSGTCKKPKLARNQNPSSSFVPGWKGETKTMKYVVLGTKKNSPSGSMKILSEERGKSFNAFWKGKRESRAEQES